MDDGELATSSYEFLGWSIFDPRAAVTRLEQVPVAAKLEMNADFARARVSELLGMTREERIREIWGRETLMQFIIGREFR